MAVFAQPGGPDLDRTWPMMKPHADAVRGFVEDGGIYLGFCLGRSDLLATTVHFLPAYADGSIAHQVPSWPARGR